MWNKVILYTLLLFFNQLCYGLDNSKQRYTTSNTDFLLHETGTNEDFIRKQHEPSSNSGKRDYLEQFPALKSPTTSSTSLKFVNNNLARTITSQTSGKRDYVSSNFPPQKPQGQHKSNAGKGDYAAQFPALNNPTTSSTTIKSFDNRARTTNTQASGKRDYVAPQFPPLKPQSQDSTGRVKDLVHFFDSKSETNTPQNGPSYSSILQGSGGIVKTGSTAPSNNNDFGQSGTQKTPYNPSRSNPNKPKESGSLATFTTQMSSTKSHHGQFKSTTGNLAPVTRPTTTVVLPSALNNNRNNNQVRTVTDSDIQTLSEELLRKDANNAAKYITVNYQEKTTSYSSEDKAPNPLLNITADAWNIPTIQKFVPLLDNYERDTLVNEYVTPQERNEENAFMDAIMSTSVIRHLMNFLKDKGFVTPDPRQQRDFLKQLWFSLYSRGKGKISSSGFEHIFVSELKNGEVSGLHNWIYFSKEETANRINYLGYLKYVQLNEKGVVMKLHFNQQGFDKPVDSMFIGTSPELEIALYTLCFVTRADNDCKLKLANKDVQIVTHTFRYRSKNLIGSAYPQI